MTAEDQLLATCRYLHLPCRILRPTLIYGRVGSHVDRNLSRLIQLMRRLPLLPLPAQTGLRQPIHASQLAAVVIELVSQFSTSGWDPRHPQRMALGGDFELSYLDMLLALQQSLPPTDPAFRCRFLSVPNRIFYALAAPLLLQSPKAFEAVLRMGSDLSGFTPVHQLLKVKPQPFPVSHCSNKVLVAIAIAAEIASLGCFSGSYPYLRSLLDHPNARSSHACQLLEVAALPCPSDLSVFCAGVVGLCLFCCNYSFVCCTLGDCWISR